MPSAKPAEKRTIVSRIEELEYRVKAADDRHERLAATVREWTSEMERMMDPINPDGLRKLFRLLAGVHYEGREL